MTISRHIATNEDVNKRVDVLLTRLTTYSRQSIQVWIKKGLVKVNGKKVKPSYTCVLNDDITWHEPEEEKLEIIPENIPLQIIYEDNDIIVVNKVVGMLTHPTQTEWSGTLVNALLNYTTSLSNASGEERPGIVHRLDKATSGIMVIAKNNAAHSQLVNQFIDRKVKRQYEAIVHGVIDHNYGIIKAPIGRNPNNRQNMTVINTGKDAETHFTVIKRYNNFTHVRCELKTGRTHQIRVHMQHIGHPLVGDSRYGKQADKTSNHLLFAQKLGFLHPKTDEWLTFTVECPTHFEKMLQRLNKMS